MIKIELTETHKRLISSLFFILEQKTESIEHIIKESSENASYVINQEIPENRKKQILNACGRLKELIQQTSNELGLKKRKISQVQYINTIQSHMWEHISDSFSNKMTGYGEKVVARSKMIDPYMQQIAEIIDEIQL